ncbi:MAG TPA: hypothetical protein VII56_01770 [Rhizomicrobium sp.]
MPKRTAQIRRERGTKSKKPRLLIRLQRLLYEFDELGYFKRAKPLLLLLMEIAKEAEEKE